MFTLFVIAVALASFAAGLLVGRRNPAIADEAAALANKVNPAKPAA